MRRILAAVTLVAIGSATAVAADLPTQEYKSAPVVAAVYNWTGIYVGANAGYGSGKQDPLGLFSNDFSAFNYTLSGGMIGGTFGVGAGAANAMKENMVRVGLNYRFGG
jgi:outer membrane immunogenic protein